MGELYNEDFFKKRDVAKKQQASTQRWLTIGLIVLAVIALIGLGIWRYTHNPDTMIFDLNRASAEELQYVPGVGPAIARDIIKGRPYKSVEELKNVKGIGEKTFDKMKTRVKVE